MTASGKNHGARRLVVTSILLLGLGCDSVGEQASSSIAASVELEAHNDGGSAQDDASPASDAAPPSPLDGSSSTDAEPGAGGGHPFDGLDDAALEKRLLEAPETLGAVALGTPDVGSLLNAVKMPQGEGWQIVEPYQSWGTPETIASIIRAIEKVHEQHENTPPLYVGDLGRKYGGYIHPHKFHQTGRDVDLGFYYSSPKRWYWKAYRSNLDVPRTWSLIKALVTETDLELVFCDRYVTRLVRAHAAEIGEDPAFLRKIFSWRQETESRPLVRHEDGHRTHLHVRFFNPIAQESGRRLYPILKKRRMLRHPTLLLDHTVVAGESLSSLARRYKTSQRAIRRLNKLPSNDLETGRTYLVPKVVKLVQDRNPIKIPPRPLPSS